jgi:hypothetical protein
VNVFAMRFHRFNAKMNTVSNLVIIQPFFDKPYDFDLPKSQVEPLGKGIVEVVSAWRDTPPEG